MYCENGQCGFGNPIEFIGGPIDGYVDREMASPTNIIIIIQAANQRRAAIYQLDETETRYLFRNEVLNL